MRSVSSAACRLDSSFPHRRVETQIIILIHRMARCLRFLPGQPWLALRPPSLPVLELLRSRSKHSFSSTHAQTLTRVHTHIIFSPQSLPSNQHGPASSSLPLVPLLRLPTSLDARPAPPPIPQARPREASAASKGLPTHPTLPYCCCRCCCRCCWHGRHGRSCPPFRVSFPPSWERKSEGGREGGRARLKSD